MRTKAKQPHTPQQYRLTMLIMKAQPTMKKKRQSSPVL